MDKTLTQCNWISLHRGKELQQKASPRWQMAGARALVTHKEGKDNVGGKPSFLLYVVLASVYCELKYIPRVVHRATYTAQEAWDASRLVNTLRLLPLSVCYSQLLSEVVKCATDSQIGLGGLWGECWVIKLTYWMKPHQWNGRKLNRVRE